MNKLVALNAQNRRIGEDHRSAKLTDGEVEQIRRLHEGGMGYSRIAVKFEISKSSVALICRYERRAQTTVRFKLVPAGVD